MAIALPFASKPAAMICKVWPEVTVAVEGEIVMAASGPDVTDTTVEPLTLPFDAVIVVVPTLSAVNTLEELIVPTVVLLLLHVTVALIGLPDWSFGEAVKVCMLPEATETEDGVAVIVVSTGARALY